MQKFHIDARKAALKEALAARGPEGAKTIDWATAEAMAVSTLLSSGKSTVHTREDRAFNVMMGCPIV